MLAVALLSVLHLLFVLVLSAAPLWLQLLLLGNVFVLAVFVPAMALLSRLPLVFEIHELTETILACPYWQPLALSLVL